MAESLIQVEVVHALPEQQTRVRLALPVGSTLLMAVQQSGLIEHLGLTLDLARLGIFGRLCAADTPLKAGDRVEIYRPLIADPKEARKRRAAVAASARKVKESDSNSSG